MRALDEAANLGGAALKLVRDRPGWYNAWVLRSTADGGSCENVGVARLIRYGSARRRYDGAGPCYIWHRMTRLITLPASPSTHPPADPEVDLWGLVRAVWGRRLLILVSTLACGLVALGISMALPRTYVAVGTILPMQTNDTSGMLAAGVAAQLGPMAGMLGGLGGGRTADLVEILGSRTLVERVVERCHLERELTGWKFRSDLVAMTRKMIGVVPPGLKSKAIEIRVEARQPELAARMVNAVVDELKRMLDEIGYNSAAKHRSFVQRQLETTHKQLAGAEDRLAGFQATHRLVSLPDTVIAAIRSVSDLEAQRVATEIQLKATDETLGAARTRAEALQTDPSAVMELELKRRGLMAQRAAVVSSQRDFQQSLAELPPRGVELARLQRDVQVQNAVYLALSQQLQTALIDENKDSDVFYPLDRAIAPDHPASPRKVLNTLVGLAAGFFLSCMYVLARFLLEAGGAGDLEVRTI